MTIAFYEHPFSSYVQKAKTALYEKGILFESKMMDGSGAGRQRVRRALADPALPGDCRRRPVREDGLGRVLINAQIGGPLSEANRRRLLTLRLTGLDP